MKVISEPREEIESIFRELYNKHKGISFEGHEIHSAHDIQAFYQLIQHPAQIIHVQGYPGMSNQKEMRVWARMMDYGLMMAARDYGASIGNEHVAVVQKFPNFAHGVNIPYDVEVLEKMLAENVPELNFGDRR
jgi:hypothetical protein